MTKQMKTQNKNYMTMSFEFSGVRLQDGYSTPVDWELLVNLTLTKKKDKSKEEVEARASIIYQKLYFWLDTNLQYVLAVNVENEDDLYIANLSSNITMHCPGNPSDDLIIRLIHSKLVSLAGNDINIGKIKLKGSDTSLQYSFDCIDDDYELPDTTEYYPCITCRDIVPWWVRNDGFSFEFARPVDSELTDEEIFSGIIDPLIEFDKIVSAMAETQLGSMREPARIVQVEKWKPRKVE